MGKGETHQGGAGEKTDKGRKHKARHKIKQEMTKPINSNYDTCQVHKEMYFQV